MTDSDETAAAQHARARARRRADALRENLRRRKQQTIETPQPPADGATTPDADDADPAGAPLT